jgi:small subunit ribosomal protein S7
MQTLLKSTLLFKKLSSLLMFNGKKKLIFKTVLKTLQRFQKNGVTLKHFCALTTIFHRIKPILETRKVRKGSKFYEVPYPIKKSRALSLLLRWVTKSIRKQATHLNVGLKNEFQDLIDNEGKGTTIKESKALNNKVSANIMYSHYRWR